MVQKYFSQFLLGILRLVSLLPPRFLYVISDGLAWLLCYLVRYRRGVVECNLKNSFPDLSWYDRQKIIQRYYKHLADIMVESLMTERMTPDDFHRRMKVLNPEVINQYHERGQSVIVLAMHYGNWEWMISLPLVLQPVVMFVYKPLHNPVFDRFINAIRCRFGGKVVSMSLALRKILEAEAQQKAVLTWLAADQAPPWFHKLWIRFMNQDTQFFDGPAKIAQRFKQPVLIQFTRKVKRGHYETWFETLTEDPESMDQTDILKQYAARMENHFREAPEYFLWSHRRWKHKRPLEQPLS